MIGSAFNFCFPNILNVLNHSNQTIKIDVKKGFFYPVLWSLMFIDFNVFHVMAIYFRFQKA